MAAPIPDPEGMVLAGSREPSPLPLTRWSTSKALPEYCEPEWVTKLVEEGKLPPVEERLPKEPKFVYKTDACPMASALTAMCGVISRLAPGRLELRRWRRPGWFGIEAMSMTSLVKTGAMFLTKQVNPFPTWPRAGSGARTVCS